MADKFLVRNNSARTIGIAGRMCIAGAGCSTPVEVAKATTFRFEPMFELTEEEMFKSFRGVVATMKQMLPNGKPTLDVMLPGNVPVTAENLLGWADEYRDKKGWKKPTTALEHGQEIERSMNRPEDPLEMSVRRAQEDRDTRMVEMVARTVLAALKADKAPAAVAPVAPEAPAQRARGRNDEKA